MNANNIREPLIKSKNYERRAPKLNFGRSTSADNSGGCATLIHPTRLNQSFLRESLNKDQHPNSSVIPERFCREFP